MLSIRFLIFAILRFNCLICSAGFATRLYLIVMNAPLTPPERSPRSLRDENLVEKNPATGKYAPGYFILSGLAMALSKHIHLILSI